MNIKTAVLTSVLFGFHMIAAEAPEAELKRAFRNLIDAENKHNLPTVKSMVWKSDATLFVAKAPVGWQGYWGLDDVTKHLGDLYTGTFRIDPIYEDEKVVFLRPDVAEIYAPVKITVAYAGQNPTPRPFIMVLVWMKTAEGWKMATDIPIPVPPDPAPR